MSIKTVMLREFAVDLGNIISLYDGLPKKLIYTKMKRFLMMLEQTKKERKGKMFKKK